MRICSMCRVTIVDFTGSRIRGVLAYLLAQRRGRSSLRPGKALYTGMLTASAGVIVTT